MTCVAPYIDESGCVVTESCVGQVAVPARTARTGVRGWNSGAISIIGENGPAVLTLNMTPAVVGALVGLFPAGAAIAVPAAITHGWYFSGGVACVIEQGNTRTTPQPYAVADTFQVRRRPLVSVAIVNGRPVTAVSSNGIEYLKNNVVVYTSAQQLVGWIYVGSCLYASYDAVPAPGVGAISDPGQGVPGSGTFDDGTADGTTDGTVDGQADAASGNFYHSYGLTWGASFRLGGDADYVSGYAGGYPAGYQNASSPKP